MKKELNCTENGYVLDTLHFEIIDPILDMTVDCGMLRVGTFFPNGYPKMYVALVCTPREKTLLTDEPMDNTTYEKFYKAAQIALSNNFKALGYDVCVIAENDEDDFDDDFLK